WTTPEQLSWLEKRVPEFIQARQSHTTHKFFMIAYFEWSHRFDSEPPNAKELEKAEGNVEKATSMKNKKEKKRFREWFYNHTRPAPSHRPLNLSNKKTGYLHPFQAYMSL
ncbi:hypothetical protein C8Q79DRAFT_874573, partial [Trametes meyenii]